MQRRPIFLLAASLLALAARPTRACDIPVYRYALEHWTPDPYDIEVSHRGPLATDEQAIIAALEKRSAGANFVVRTTDADAEGHDKPWLAVRFPAASRIAGGVAWEGKLTADATASALDSPCRREIADRLLAGDAVVWVLLQTGRKDEDDAAAARIRDQLGRPGADGQPPPVCSLVTVARNDATERLLIETLLSAEPDLRGRDEPMAFPVFGRGRVLYALAGAGINAGTVGHALDFLVGGCSCTVKRQNPGVDLLLTADWSVITPTSQEEAPASSAPDDQLVPLTPLPPAPMRPAAALAQPEPPHGYPPWLIAAVAVAAVLVLATGWLALRSGKRPNQPPV